VHPIDRRRALVKLGGVAAAGLAATACGTVHAGAPSGTALVRRRPPGTLLWHARAAASQDEPRIVAADGMVYVTGGGQDRGDSGTYAFNAATGKLMWRIAGPRTYATGPGAAFGFQVSSGDVTTVVASSAATGRPLWTHDAGHLLDNAKVGSLSYADGLVYIAAGTTTDDVTGQPAVRALDARTGRRVWRSYVGGPLQEPAVADGRVYVATTNQIAALNATTGARLWESAKVGENPFPVVVVDGVVCGIPITTNAAAPAFGLDSVSGRRLWQANVPGVVLTGTGSIALFMSAVIGMSNAATTFTVLARRARSGQAAWKHTFPGEPAVAAGGGVLYVGSGDRTIRAITAATGTTLWSHRLAAPPADVAVDSNTVYVLDQNSVYALQA
jgi:outer membrane protein assembly factor BamB